MGYKALSYVGYNSTANNKKDYVMDHLGRLLNEYSELALKISKLETFLYSKVFEGLDGIDRCLLKQQFTYMEGYCDTLRMRIEKGEM